MVYYHNNVTSFVIMLMVVGMGAIACMLFYIQGQSNELWAERDEYTRTAQFTPVTESIAEEAESKGPTGPEKESDTQLTTDQETQTGEQSNKEHMDTDEPTPETTTEKPKTINTDRDLIVIAAASVNKSYYRDNFQSIVDFDIEYINQVSPHDEIRIIVDEETLPYFEGKIDQSHIIVGQVEDIWMRDFSTVNPNNPVQFRYTSAAYDDDESFTSFVQKSFNTLTRGFSHASTNYYIDGGNVVDNGAGRVVVTERFLEDNDLSYDDGVFEIKRLLGADQVAIIPADDPVLAHADGMVMFIESNTIVVNKYNEPFRTDVIAELEYAFPGIAIIEVEIGDSGTAYDKNISSACGINVNSVVTRNNIYVPHFGDQNSDEFIKTVSAHTTKNIVPINAQGVCGMGGSVRCLSWQLHGEQAKHALSVLD